MNRASQAGLGLIRYMTRGHASGAHQRAEHPDQRLRPSRVGVHHVEAAQQRE